jgi:hypothetical protein
VAGEGAVRCAGTALRAAVIRVAVTGGLTLLACVFGSAVASAATSHDTPQPKPVSDTLQSDLSSLVNGLLTDLGRQSHLRLPAPDTLVLLQQHGNGQGSQGNGVHVNSLVHPGNSQNAGNQGNGNGNDDSQGNEDTGSSSSSSQGNQGTSASSTEVWTGTTTVTVPTKAATPPPPPAPPAPPVAPPPVHVQPTAPPISTVVGQPAAKTTEPSMGKPSGAVPDLPQNPSDLPLEQPAAQPISSPSTSGSSSGHDLGGANGVAAVVPPGAGFRPSPGSTTDEHSAKRVSDGVPGLPSTSPD